MTIVAFVKFKTKKSIYSVFSNGLIRGTTGVEWYDLRAAGQPYADVPVIERPDSEEAAYEAYDKALRA